MARALIVASLAVLACSADHEPSDWTLETSDCRLESSATIGGQSAEWAGCRVHYYADGNVYTVQLMRAGTSGSFLTPGPGWLTINLNGDSPEETTLRVAAVLGGTLPTSVPVDAISVIYTTTDGRMLQGSGQLQVGQNAVSASSKTLAFEADLSGLTFTSAASGGSIGVAAAPGINAPTGGGGDGGGGGGTCGANVNCSNYETQCKNSMTAQGPCYCWAACECAKACNSCAGSNAANARSVGYPCPF